MVQKRDVPDAITVIHSRTSVRSFTGEAVSNEDLEEILRAGMAAPSAVGRSPWEFVVVTDRATLSRLREGLPYAKMLDKAGAAIVVCGIPAKAHLQKVEYAVIDGTCASENILLAVEALGLGAVWTAAYPYEDRAAHVRKVLGIPGEVIPLNVIPIGHPTGADTPKEKYDPGMIHHERW
jgi:nitroreductase